MGIAIADEAASRGAFVKLVLGPTELRPLHSGVSVINVTSAKEMASESKKLFAESDIGILSAAVADFRPVAAQNKKIKSDTGNLILELKPTEDIAAELGKSKKAGQILVGFALETDSEVENAMQKLDRKNLDLIILNSLRDEGAGFGFETNKITAIDRSNNIDKFELKSKVDVAGDILDKIESLLK
jgi:phosphopantothenoylcysteine decarboxylase/phosphopantothenate--cysteine ligase